MTTAVELEQAALDPDHPHHVKEEQLLIASVPQVFETTRVKCDNEKMADKGIFKLQMFSPKDGKPKRTSDVRCDMSASQFRGGINDYYRDAGMGDVTVERKRWSAANVEVETNEETAYVTYDIILRKMINGESTDGDIAVVKGSAKSKIEVTRTVKSGKPISGKFKIQCADAKGPTIATKA
jgi:hypothetical protein